MISNVSLNEQWKYQGASFLHTPFLAFSTLEDNLYTIMWTTLCENLYISLA
jgi:hypothetical protein